MEILVVGAGVVGLAIGRSLAGRGHSVIVAERADSIGTGVSSRNSEVVHAGLYYPADWLRTRHCVAGRRLLYAYCASRGVPHRRCGKLVVAADAAEETKIAGIAERGAANGVSGLSMIDGARARQLEPNLSCLSALLSEETGIVDSHALMLALHGEIEDGGSVVAFNTTIDRLDHGPAGWDVSFTGDEPGSLTVDAVVNAAGLGAQRLAQATAGYPSSRIPPLILARGNYFGCTGRPAFTRLIYPAPVDGGLGTHLTLDMGGRIRFGPDVEWVDREGYEVDPERARSFYAAIRRFWPGLPDDALVPDYAGIRPKLTGRGEAPADFVVDGPEQHGLPGLVQLFGIESPGLTAALSLAEDVADWLSA